MKQNGKEKRSKLHPVKKPAPTAQARPTLREYWAELQRAKAAGEPLPAAPSVSPVSASYASGGGNAAPSPVSGARHMGAQPPAPGMPAAAGRPHAEEFPSPHAPSSGSGGSNGAGYGLGLIVPDEASLARIRKIMRALCERDKARKAGL